MRGAKLKRIPGSWFVVALALALASAGSSARGAETGLYQLETTGWRHGCPNPAQLRKEIVSNLGRDPFATQAEKTVAITIEASDDGLGGVVELLGPSRELIGKRTIAASHRRCVDLSKALALVVTLALDESERQSERARESAGPAARTPEVEAATASTAVASARVQPESPRLRWQIATGVTGSVWSGPGMGLGGLVAVEGQGRRWSFGMEGSGGTFLGSAVPGGSVAGSLEAGTLTGCWRPAVLGWLGLGACGLATAGWEQARPSGFAGAHAAAGPFLAGGARLLLEASIGRKLSLMVNADPAMPIVRAHFMIGNLDLWQAPPFSLAGGLRVAYAF